MTRFCTFALLLCLALGVRAAEPEYTHEIARWQEVAVPPENPQGPYMVWFYGANYSKLTWRVFNDEGKPAAENANAVPAKRPTQPNFVPEVAGFHGGFSFAEVDDGWLVGFNQGEFGAALYWFSQNGKRNYKISDHQVVKFVSQLDGIYAIEGLAHLGSSEGSVIRIARSIVDGHWKATTVTKLPIAPYAVSLRSDGTMLVTLSGSLVSIGPDHEMRTLLSSASWHGLYPNSSILSPDETKLYIGMRQFVGEFDLTTNKFRLLIPSIEFLNKLSPDVEKRMLKQYGG